MWSTEPAMPETNASVLSLILTCPSVSPPPQSHDATAAAKRSLPAYVALMAILTLP